MSGKISGGFGGFYRHDDMLVVAAADALDDPQDHGRHREQAEADLGHTIHQQEPGTQRASTLVIKEQA